MCLPSVPGHSIQLWHLSVACSRIADGVLMDSSRLFILLQVQVPVLKSGGRIADGVLMDSSRLFILLQVQVSVLKSGGRIADGVLMDSSRLFILFQVSVFRSGGAKPEEGFPMCRESNIASPP